MPRTTSRPRSKWPNRHVQECLFEMYCERWYSCMLCDLRHLPQAAYVAFVAATGFSELGTCRKRRSVLTENFNDSAVHGVAGGGRTHKACVGAETCDVGRGAAGRWQCRREAFQLSICQIYLSSAKEQAIGEQQQHTAHFGSSSKRLADATRATADTSHSANPLESFMLAARSSKL